MPAQNLVGYGPHSCENRKEVFLFNMDVCPSVSAFTHRREDSKSVSREDGVILEEVYDLNLSDIERKGSVGYIKNRSVTMPQIRNRIDQAGCSSLRVGHRHMGARPVTAIAKSLTDNETVTYLDLSYNDIQEAGIGEIADMLLENSCITHLDLSNNNLRTVGARLIGRVLLHNTTITHLNIAGNKFTEKDGHFLAQGIERNKFVTDLNLSNNEFSEEGAQVIGRALGRNNNLESVNLSWNHIRLKGAVTMCRELELNSTLTKIDLSFNGFGYEGALAVSKLLKRNAYLEEIDLSNNRINWDGALFISEGLQKNQTLRILKLGGNPLTTTGAQDLLEAIALSQSAVSMLDISNVSVMGEFEMMAHALQIKRASFLYKHGGIVRSHDVLGQRHARRIDPMQRVINYMDDQKIRPTELFRSFDKSVMFNMTDSAFMTRLKKTGISLDKWEIRELMRDIEDQEVSEGKVNYVGLVHAVKDQVVSERRRQIIKRERQRRLAEYHNRILNPDFPVLQVNDLSEMADSQKGKKKELKCTDHDRKTAPSGFKSVNHTTTMQLLDPREKGKCKSKKKTKRKRTKKKSS